MWQFIRVLLVFVGVAVIFLTPQIHNQWQVRGKWTQKMNWLTVVYVFMFILILVAFPICAAIVTLIVVFIILLKTFVLD